MDAGDTGAPLEPEPGFRLGAGKLKYVTDVLKSLGVVLTGAAVVTPAFTDRSVGTLNLVWLLVAFALILTGFTLTPKD